MNSLQRAAIIGLLQEAAHALQDHGCSPEHEKHPDLIYRLTHTAEVMEEVNKMSYFNRE